MRLRKTSTCRIEMTSKQLLVFDNATISVHLRTDMFLFNYFLRNVYEQLLG